MTRIMQTRVARIGLILCLAAASVAGGQSLWPRRSGTSLFSDHRALAIGDALTIIVDEQSSVSRSANMSLAKTSNTEAKLDTLNWPKGTNASPVLHGLMPEIKADSSRTFDGEGEYALSGKMETRLTVIVIEVLPNGNLVVEGSRVRRQADETTTVTISGIVRPEDVSSANTVSSSALAQGKITFKSSGPITRSSRRGWLEWLIDFVWPF